jgi:N,N'-diacetyllegionaminate synthase
VQLHYTISKQLPGPDHIFAVEPHELKEMIDNIRLTEVSLSRKKDGYTKSEEDFKYAGRSIIATKAIKKGDLLNQSNITTKRPFLENTTPASKWFDTLGTKAIKDYKPDDFI